MTRTLVIASSYARAALVAALLREDDRILVTDVLWTDQDLEHAVASILADVIVAVDRDPETLLDFGKPILCVSDRPVRQRLFSAGVCAWLPATSSAEELSAAVEGAAKDFVLLTKEQATRWLTGSTRQSSENAIIEALTSRELQVLRMLASGLGNKEIAAQLNISDHTAKFHVAQILAKLGAVSRTEAVAIGIRKGLVPV